MGLPKFDVRLSFDQASDTALVPVNDANIPYVIRAISEFIAEAMRDCYELADAYSEFDYDSEKELFAINIGYGGEEGLDKEYSFNQFYQHLQEGMALVLEQAAKDFMPSPKIDLDETVTIFSDSAENYIDILQTISSIYQWGWHDPKQCQERGYSHSLTDLRQIAEFQAEPALSPTKTVSVIQSRLH